MSEAVDLSRAMWRKSSFSNGQGGACVEVAPNLPGIVAVRDSKDRDGGVLRFSPDEWKTFLASVRTASGS